MDIHDEKLIKYNEKLLIIQGRMEVITNLPIILEILYL